MKNVQNILNKMLIPFKSRREYKEELTEEQKRRLDICSSCPFNSDISDGNMSLKNKIYLFLNKQLNRWYGLKLTIDAICLVCGCGIVFMSSQEAEENKCKLKKW